MECEEPAEDTVCLERKGRNKLRKLTKKRDPTVWVLATELTHFKSPELKAKDNILSISSQIMSFINTTSFCLYIVNYFFCASSLQLSTSVLSDAPETM